MQQHLTFGEPSSQARSTIALGRCCSVEHRQHPHLLCHWRFSASFHIQKGAKRHSAAKSALVTCTKRLSPNSWKYSCQASPPANAACAEQHSNASEQLLESQNQNLCT